MRGLLRTGGYSLDAAGVWRKEGSDFVVVDEYIEDDHKKIVAKFAAAEVKQTAWELLYWLKGNK
jgi:hypothetical protein